MLDEQQRLMRTVKKLVLDVQCLKNTVCGTTNETVLQLIKASTLKNMSYFWENDAARVAQEDMKEEEKGYQVDTADLYEYDGAAWILIGALEEVEQEIFSPYPECTIGEIKGQYKTFAEAKAAGYTRMLQIEDVYETASTTVDGSEVVWGIGNGRVTWYFGGNAGLSDSIADVRDTKISVNGASRVVLPGVEKLDRCNLTVETSAPTGVTLLGSGHVSNCHLFPNNNNNCLIVSTDCTVENSTVHSGGDSAQNIITGNVTLQNVSFAGDFNSDTTGCITVDHVQGLTADGDITISVEKSAYDITLDKTKTTNIRSSSGVVYVKRCIAKSIGYFGTVGHKVYSDCDTDTFIVNGVGGYVYRNTVANLVNVGHSYWSFEDCQLTAGARLYSASATVVGCNFRNCVCGVNGGSTATIEVTNTASLTNIKDCIVETDVLDNGTGTELAWKKFDGTGGNLVNNPLTLTDLANASSQSLVTCDATGKLQLVTGDLARIGFYDCTVGGVDGQYATIGAAIDDGNKKILLVGSTTESADITLESGANYVVSSISKDNVMVFVNCGFNKIDINSFHFENCSIVIAYSSSRFLIDQLSSRVCFCACNLVNNSTVAGCRFVSATTGKSLSIVDCTISLPNHPDCFIVPTSKTEIMNTTITGNGALCNLSTVVFDATQNGTLLSGDWGVVRLGGLVSRFTDSTTTCSFVLDACDIEYSTFAQGVTVAGNNSIEHCRLGGAVSYSEPFSRSLFFKCLFVVTTTVQHNYISFSNCQFKDDVIVSGHYNNFQFCEVASGVVLKTIQVTGDNNILIGNTTELTITNTGAGTLGLPLNNVVS